MEMIPISEKGKNNKSFEDIKHIDKHGVEFLVCKRTYSCFAIFKLAKL